MPKLGMQPVRKNQMIQAMMSCIATDGIHKSSMQRVASKAGLTPSLIVHYFKDRNSLIHAVYTHLYQQMNSEIRRREANATTPRQRIFAICDAQVSQMVLTQELVVTWVTLYALLPEFPALRRLDRIYVARMRSNLVYHMKQLGLQQDHALSLASEITSLIDGLWVKKAGNPNLPQQDIRSVVHGYLNRQLPSH